ncbi:MAG: carbohydrate kinase family protein [Balneolaceae bacterium]|nr:carbohydrate kinase family protein [Balneolaceae bacterium]
MEKRKIDVLVVGDLNVDLILNKINKPPQIGEEQMAREMDLTMGGSTAIFACNIAKLGSKVEFISKLGDDSFGKFLLNKLRLNHVGIDSIIVDNSLRTGATIILFIDDDRMMVTYPGSMEHLSVDEISNDILRSSKHIHTSAIFFQPLLKKELSQLFERAKNLGVSTSMDTQWDPNELWDVDLENILPNLDFFLPNEEEFIQLTNQADLESALNSVAHHDTCFVIKRGEKGVLMFNNGNRTELKSLPVPNIVDTIGAGDSFNAGFIQAHLKGLELGKCLEFGNKTAAVSTTAPGGISAIKSYNQVLETAKEFKQ